MIEKGARGWDRGLGGACQGGHLSIAQLMIEKGAWCLNVGLDGACQGGHLDLVELMIEKGATKWTDNKYPKNINKVLDQYRRKPL
jgi:hypothetical protein